MHALLPFTRLKCEQRLFTPPAVSRCTPSRSTRRAAPSRRRCGSTPSSGAATGASPSPPSHSTSRRPLRALPAPLPRPRLRASSPAPPRRQTREEPCLSAALRAWSSCSGACLATFSEGPLPTHVLRAHPHDPSVFAAAGYDGEPHQPPRQWPPRRRRVHDVTAAPRLSLRRAPAVGCSGREAALLARRARAGGGGRQRGRARGGPRHPEIARDDRAARGASFERGLP